MEHLYVQWVTPCQAAFLYMPHVTDAGLSLQGEFQLMWCCVEAQFSFVGRYILSCHYIQKFTKKNVPAPLTTGCEAGSPELSLPVRQLCGVGGFAQCFFWNKSRHMLHQNLLATKKSNARVRAQRFCWRGILAVTGSLAWVFLAVLI